MNHPFRILPIIFRARRPSSTADMPAVADAFWLKRGYTAMTFFGKIITHTQQEAEALNKGMNALKRHELIHLRQAQSCGDSWLRFYWKYLGYWLKGCRMRRKLPNAGYLLNPFEMEAYAHMYDADYLDSCVQGAEEWRHYAGLTLEERLRLYLNTQCRKTP